MLHLIPLPKRLRREKAEPYMNCILQRRSIRKFKDVPVSDDTLERLLEAAMAAPSANGRRPWEFLLVMEPRLRREISEVSPYAKAAAYAPALIVVLANLTKAGMGKHWWVQDLAACTENILLQAVEEGLGAVWLGIYPDENRCRKLSILLSLPSYVIPFSVVAVGLPGESPAPRSGSESMNVFAGIYGTEWNGKNNIST